MNSQRRPPAWLAGLDARARGGQHLPRAAPALRVEGLPQPQHHVQVFGREQLGHEVELFDADAVLAGDAASQVDTLLENLVAGFEDTVHLGLVALALHAGARFLGEFAFGTNEGIQRHTRNILFDEKIGGTVHMAVGGGYPETGSTNQSSVHWDMIADLRQGGEVTVDGEPFLRDGQFVV